LRSPRAALLVAAATLGARVAGLWEPPQATAAPRHELRLGIQLESVYDDNVFNGRGPDWVHRVGPRLGWRLRSPRLLIETRYLFGVWSYAFGKASNSLNHRASIELTARLSRRLTIGFEGDLVRAEDPGFLPRGNVLAPQVGITQSLSALSATLRVTRSLSLAASYQLLFSLFDPLPLDRTGGVALTNGAEHALQLRARLRLGRRSAVRLALRLQLFSAGDGGHYIDTWRLGVSYTPTVGWEQRLGRFVELSFEAGPLVYQSLPDSSQLVDATRVSGVTLRASGRLRWLSPRLRSSLGYTRDLVGATGVGSALWFEQLTWQGRAMVHPRLQLEAAVGAFRNGRAVSEPYSFEGITAEARLDGELAPGLWLGPFYALRVQRIGRVTSGAEAAATEFALADVVRTVIGLRLTGSIELGARPHRRENRP
jgi:hypothetical protein